MNRRNSGRLRTEFNSARETHRALFESGHEIGLHPMVGHAGQSNDGAIGQQPGGEPQHSLIAVLVGQYDQKTKDLLIAAHPVLEPGFTTRGVHHPNLLFFNLETDRIYCMGIGRKARFFEFDASGEEVDAAYMDRFTSSDPAGSIRSIKDSFLDYCQALANQAGIGPSSWEIKDRLAQVDEDGIWRDEFDDENETTREELEEMLETQEDYEDDQRISLGELARFFPRIGEVQIDPGDY